MYGSVIGGVGKVEQKDVNGSFLLVISIVEEKYFKGEKKATWYNVSYWGKRAEAIFPHIFKGQKITATGQSYLDEYEGKKYLKMDADHINLQSWPKDGEKKEESQGNNHYNPAGPQGNNSPKSEWSNEFQDDIPL